MSHLIKLEKEKQTYETMRRIRITWTATGKLGIILMNSAVPINLKWKVFNTYILSVLTYGIETMLFTIKSPNKLSTTQRSIERLMLGKTLRGRIRNDNKRRKTGVEDVVRARARVYVDMRRARRSTTHKQDTKHEVFWKPRTFKKSVGRP